LDMDLKEGLQDCAQLNAMKIMGAILHPLFQNKKRMIASGICTDKQYEAGKKELLSRISRMLDTSSATGQGSTTAPKGDRPKNVWSDDDDDDDDVVVVSPSMKLAQDELTLFEKHNKTRYLPKMKPTKSLGSYDQDGNPLADPVLVIGEVISKGEDLPSGKNHADYIDKKGYYDVVKCLQDHKTSEFKGLSKVFIGTLAPHITTEVDCESLFSQAGHAAHPNRNRTVAETFERLAMGKHRLSRICCSPEKAKVEFIEQWKKNSWSESKDRDDLAFWEQQKKEYLELNPGHAGVIAELEEHDDAVFDDEGEQVQEGL